MVRWFFIFLIDKIYRTLNEEEFITLIDKLIPHSKQFLKERYNKQLAKKKSIFEYIS
jgi:hypothetical protein